MIAIVDYGMGNIASVSNAFKSLGYDVCITDNYDELAKASHIILPGVGSFRAAVTEINRRDLKDSLRELAKRKPVLGICLGMQLLFSDGYEGGKSKGLNLIPGTVEKIQTNLILPHIGWNTLNIQNSQFENLQNKHVYFVHSYEVKTKNEYIMATTNYEVKIPAIVRKDNVYGMQFHPEKSGAVGRQLLNIFLHSTQEVRM
ncbi:MULTISPECIES: imidazole glycerol phosphate synthase subunit HisH [Heyndrickxia]|uniref:Imidazole glycerol phosphate synthase subunit HisH n=1 Tax=Heyndrickxia sporothermodurans TaxID=46224 RepID=A0A150L816_9BACI|nr:imidazole glycerol phosphate synthase subunit HisH [Heyndrickxia sporothermodurans]KYD08468.1 hypothetical protein B4102_2745 [Heyndrickxia sporothermodurans]MBL5767397.1 imidazole glycerol phosphate synthase subunit HisH [Heyndrickxia sporothermodurans]MBL5770747.1 imidazole glycerol phosphate synthase subunit HisH [Heyndrickxia sporothermodurans]MBL5774509.1 imidazole glycerol phosphate synthase subunit HisH [Heyndrickxia sporothermodurans]MBL5777870.1 imidazole glycerol phosphate synthas